MTSQLLSMECHQRRTEGRVCRCKPCRPVNLRGTQSPVGIIRLRRLPQCGPSQQNAQDCQVKGGIARPCDLLILDKTHVETPLSFPLEFLRERLSVLSPQDQI